MTFRSRKLLDSARGQTCVMCNADDGTIVAAHANGLEWGKGTSHKAHDGCTAWLCFRCHSLYDTGGGMTKSEKRDFILTAIVRTHMTMLDQGILQVRG